MKIKIWGSRGSTPVSGPQFSRYSGATSCIELRASDGAIFILDAGSGLKGFEEARKNSHEPGKSPIICLSHLHFDHVQGLPFYAPVYSGDVSIYGPEFPGHASLGENIRRLFDGVLFPVRWEDMKKPRLTGLAPGGRIRIGSVEIALARTNHPGGNLAWKFMADGQTLVYTGDHEIPLDESDPEAWRIHRELLDFMAGADLAIVDAHFSAEDHASHRGWGHSDFCQWARDLAGTGVRKALFTHFSPDYDDDLIDRLLAASRKLAPRLEMAAAWRGLELDCGAPAGPCVARDCHGGDFLRRVSALSDTHAVLEALLSESRKVAGADAGSVYLLDNGELSFAAAQNDSLFPGSAASKYAYLKAKLPVSRASIAGYVASTGEILNIPDLYAMPDGLEYSFNDSFDRANGYHSRSMLTVPLVNGQNGIVGVLQLINASRDGQPGGFGRQEQFQIASMANLATLPLAKAGLVVNMIMRMLQTAALRDPTETSGHVQRVGSIAAELYQRWAEAMQLDPEKVMAQKSRLRLAAMLHDVGKVGIPDGVLKKPGRLTPEERQIMEGHAALGASLFDGMGTEIERLARQIALHHHAKWDGTGYTGSSEIQTLSGRDIPLGARIVAIADVYDALVSRRCYKDAWQPEMAFDVLRKDAGSHFDPDLVDCFVEMRDVIEAIYLRFQ